MLQQAPLLAAAHRMLGAFLAGLVLPHVAEVVALSDGHDHSHGAFLLPKITRNAADHDHSVMQWSARL